MHRIPTCVLFLVLIGLAGCLEFDAQEVTLRHDAAQDRIDAMFVYRGLFAESGQGNPQGNLEKVLKDLDDALQTGEFAFWCNWPLKCDLTVNLDPVRAALAEHVEVENGGLFTDPKGVLCGYQFVRVNRAAAFLQKVNTLLEVGVQAGLLRGFDGYGPDHRVDRDTADLVREFLRSGEKILVVEGGRIELRLPCSEQDNRWIKGQVETHFLNNAPAEMVRAQWWAQQQARGESPDSSVALDGIDIPGGALQARVRNSASFRFFWDNDISLERRPELTVIGIGVRGTDELRVLKAPDGAYSDRLLQALRERGDTIEDGVPDQELQRRFAAFRERAAALPPKLAELRAK